MQKLAVVAFFAESAQPVLAYQIVVGGGGVVGLIAGDMSIRAGGAKGTVSGDVGFA